MRAQVTGIILAGGASRRMGLDKAALELGGQRLLARVAGTVGTVCEEVIVAGGRRRAEDWPEIDARWVPDAVDGAGPLAGLAAGLDASSHQRCLVVAADMPFLNGRLLERLIDRMEDCDAVVPLSDGLPQPLHAVYSRGCLATVQSLLGDGRRSLRKLLAGLSVRYVSEREAGKFDPEGLSLFNLNSRDDLRVARDHLARMSAERLAG